MGTTKCNVDASVREAGEVVQVGGVFRDHNGRFCGGFARRIDSCNVLEAEMAAVREGVQVANSIGVGALVLESDCRRAVDLLTEGGVNMDRVERLVMKVNNAAGGRNHVRFQYVGRDANKVADWMSKVKFDVSLPGIFFPDPHGTGGDP